MGYYTYYTLSLSPADNSASRQHQLIPADKDKLEDEIDRLCVFEEGNVEYGYGGEAKWYDHDRDMTLLSSRFPDILFTLKGDGEETDDRWVSYYLNGRMQYCPAEIVYPPLDMESLLASVPIVDDSTGQYSYQQSHPISIPVSQPPDFDISMNDLL